MTHEPTKAATPSELWRDITAEMSRLESSLTRLNQSLDERLDRDRIKILNGNLTAHRLEKELLEAREVNSKLTHQINEFIRSLAQSPAELPPTEQN